MPTVPEPQRHTQYTANNEYPSPLSTNCAQNPGSTTARHDYERYRHEYHQSQSRPQGYDAQGGYTYQPEHTRTAKRSPSLLRRINAAIKPRPSPSVPSTRSNSTSDYGSPSVDPMYTAPGSSSSSHGTRSHGASMNPISRFRRNRNAEKNMKRREDDVEREGRYVQREWREDGRAGPSGASSPRSRPDARDYYSPAPQRDVYWRPTTTSKHARTQSEDYYREEPRTRRSPTAYNHTRESLARSKTVGKPINPTSVSPFPRDVEGSREQRNLPTEDHPPRRLVRRAYTQPPEPASGAVRPARMGRYGIYASPPVTTTQVPSTSGTQRISDGRRTPVGHQANSPSFRQIRGSEVRVSPLPVMAAESSRGPIQASSTTRSRPAPERRLGSTSPSLTLVSDHPLMDRPLTPPPEQLDREKAEEFAMNLSKRMSVLLTMDELDIDANAHFHRQDATKNSSPGRESKSHLEASCSNTREAALDNKPL